MTKSRGKDERGAAMRRMPLLMLAAMTICLYGGPVHGVEFLTREAFKAEAGGYKDYPFRVLFQKFAQSQGDEQKKIRTAIIHKQVFDRKMQQRVDKGLITYEHYYGLVRAISEETLRFWDAATRSEKTFQVGLKAVATLNPDKHPVSRFNITRFAVVAHILDGRLYRMEIGFPLAPPSDPELRREGSRNLLRWGPPAGSYKPTGYRVFVNNKLLKALDETEVRVPRDPSRADEYTVRAVFRHGPVLVASEPSKTVFDATTAGELAAKDQARQAFDVMMAELNPARWEKAWQMLRENHALFAAHLTDESQSIVMALARFFADIEEGDRMGRMAPETVEHLDQALGYYKKARRKAEQLAPKVAVGFVADQKISTTLGRTMQVRAKNQASQAEDTLARILAALTPASWETARQLLFSHKDRLIAHLTGESLATARGLLVFFAEIDAGDRLGKGAAGSTADARGADQLTQALGFYKGAKAQSAGMALPTSVGFIADEKILETKKRIAAIETRTRTALAQQTFDRVLAGLTPGGWTDARRLLYGNHRMMAADLPPDRQETVRGLMAFFAEIDAGDRYSQMVPVTQAQLARAVGYYEKARTQAGMLGSGAAVDFIAELKIGQSKNRAEAMHRQAEAARAKKSFDQALAALTPASWSEARKILADHRQLLLEHLAPAEKSTVQDLLAVFARIDAGDRMAAMAPVAAENLEKAVQLYGDAAALGKGLESRAPVAFIAEQKRLSTTRRVASLLAVAGERQALDALDTIIAGLTPTGWPEAKQRLFAQRDMLLAHLPDAKKRIAQTLIRFFADIDAGDRLAAMAPVTRTHLEKALALYTQALAQGQTLAPAAPVAFVAEEKRLHLRQRIFAIENDQRAMLAQQAFQRVVSDLTPARWTEARKRLEAHRDLFEGHLDDGQKVLAMRMNQLFADLDRGDRFNAMTPETNDSLASALTAYQGAETHADALAGVADLRFLTRLKIEAISRRQADFKIREKTGRAEEIHQKIIEQLTPGQWRSARGLMQEHREMLASTLDAQKQETLTALDRFFSEIEEGDRLSRVRPVTRAGLENAAMFYRRAGEKAAALPGSVDVDFLARMRLTENAGQLKALEEKKQRLAAAAKRLAAAEELPPMSPIEKKKALRQAMRDFKVGNYTASLELFSRAYVEQVLKIKRRGMKRLQGVMGLPDKYRAEVVFLVELDRLMRKSSESDEYAMQEAVQRLSDRINGGRSIWAVIPMDRREKMAYRLENIRFDTGDAAP